MFSAFVRAGLPRALASTRHFLRLLRHHRCSAAICHQVGFVVAAYRVKPAVEGVCDHVFIGMARQARCQQRPSVVAPTLCIRRLFRLYCKICCRRHGVPVNCGRRQAFLALRQYSRVAATHCCAASAAPSSASILPDAERRLLWFSTVGAHGYLPCRYRTAGGMP